MANILLTASELLNLLRLQLPAVSRLFRPLERHSRSPRRIDSHLFLSPFALRQVSRSEPFWRHLNTTSLHSALVTDQVICQLSRAHGEHLRQVCLDRARLLSSAAVSTLALMSPELHSFSASGCAHISLSAIRFLCKSCGKLEVLKVAGCGEARDAL